MVFSLYNCQPQHRQYHRTFLIYGFKQPNINCIYQIYSPYAGSGQESIYMQSASAHTCPSAFLQLCRLFPCAHKSAVGVPLYPHHKIKQQDKKTTCRGCLTPNYKNKESQFLLMAGIFIQTNVKKQETQMVGERDHS